MRTQYRYKYLKAEIYDQMWGRTLHWMTQLTVLRNFIDNIQPKYY